MSKVRVSFTVFDVPDGDVGTGSESINNFLDVLGDVDTPLHWDEVTWEVIDE